MSRDPISKLQYDNLLAALRMIANEMKRYNDANTPQQIEKREPEFGRANYINRIQSEQGEELHSALLPPETKQTPPRSRREGGKLSHQDD